MENEDGERVARSVACVPLASHLTLSQDDLARIQVLVVVVLHIQQAQGGEQMRGVEAERGRRRWSAASTGRAVGAASSSSLALAAPAGAARVGGGGGHSRLRMWLDGWCPRALPGAPSRKVESEKRPSVYFFSFFAAPLFVSPRL